MVGCKMITRFVIYYLLKKKINNNIRGKFLRFQNFIFEYFREEMAISFFALSFYKIWRNWGMNFSIRGNFIYYNVGKFF